MERKNGESEFSGNDGEYAAPGRLSFRFLTRESREIMNVENVGFLMLPVRKGYKTSSVLLSAEESYTGL